MSHALTMATASGLLGDGKKAIKIHHLVKAPENTPHSISRRESWDADKPAIVYKTPENLGADRKALAAAAFFKYPNQACLIIDLGSCITYDFIDQEAVYHGGAISPGIGMRYRALHAQKEKIP